MYKNKNFGSKIEMLVKNRNFGQKFNFWSKIELFVKTKILVKNRTFGQKWNFLSKMELFVNNKILVKNRKILPIMWYKGFLHLFYIPEAGQGRTRLGRHEGQDKSGKQLKSLGDLYRKTDPKHDSAEFIFFEINFFMRFFFEIFSIFFFEIFLKIFFRKN
mgnify:CR=1 FL=1